MAIIGCGALGTVAADNLARAGVGHLILIDRDVVELNNLQRQTLFSEEDVGRPKAIAAAERLGKVNSAIKVEPAIKDINHTNVEEVVRSVDLVLDGTDNFHTRLVVNDACVKHGIPWIYAAAVGTSGLVMPVLPKGPRPALPVPGSTERWSASDLRYGGCVEHRNDDHRIDGEHRGDQGPPAQRCEMGVAHL